jgi:hypothetical protein
MRRDQLEHAIRAACDVAEDTELIIFGSQAILAEHPDAPESVRASIEVDLQPKNRPDMVDAIDGALGELSIFHQTHGFYVHGVSIESATLPAGWDVRTITVRNVNTRGFTGHCVEAHDLAASKLVAFREKDRDFITTLLVEGMIDPKTLLERIDALPVDDETRIRGARWVEAVAREVDEQKP